MTARRSYRYLGCATSTAAVTPVSSTDDHFEFDESEVWSVAATVVSPELKTATSHHHHTARPSRKPLRSSKSAAFDRPARSLPMNVPDWSKILGGEYRRRADDDVGDDVDVDVEEGNDRMPPHEYLARTRGASLSVHEGEGRTLKGRDLSRVRNAIWKQIGFED